MTIGRADPAQLHPHRLRQGGDHPRRRRRSPTGKVFGGKNRDHPLADLSGARDTLITLALTLEPPLLVVLAARVLPGVRRLASAVRFRLLFPRRREQIRVQVIDKPPSFSLM